MDKSVLHFFIHDGLLDSFEIIKVEEVANKTGDGKDLHINFEEYNILPSG